MLNNTFGGGEGGFDTDFSFSLAGITRTNNAAWFAAGPGGTNEKSMKKALRQGGNDALNVYTSTAGVYLGWAYLPDILTKPGNAHLDGIVIDWETVPGASSTLGGEVRPWRDADPRGRPLAQPRAHVLRRLQREG